MFRSRPGKFLLLTTGLLLALITWLTIAPPRLWLNLTRRVDLSNPAAAGEKLVARHHCLSCHSLDGQGSPLGPELDKVSGYMSAARLRLLLEDPKNIKSWSDMPNPHLSDDEIAAILAYLKSIALEASP